MERLIAKLNVILEKFEKELASFDEKWAPLYAELREDRSKLLNACDVVRKCLRWCTHGDVPEEEARGIFEVCEKYSEFLESS